jgi:hypothetical protein
MDLERPTLVGRARSVFTVIHASRVLSTAPPGLPAGFSGLPATCLRLSTEHLGADGDRRALRAGTTHVSASAFVGSTASQLTTALAPLGLQAVLASASPPPWSRFLLHQETRVGPRPSAAPQRRRRQESNGDQRSARSGRPAGIIGSGRW